MSRSPSPTSSRSSSRSSSRHSNASPPRHHDEAGETSSVNSPPSSPPPPAAVGSTSPAAAERSTQNATTATGGAGAVKEVDEPSLLLHGALRGDAAGVKRLLTQASAAGRAAGLLAHMYSRKPKKGGASVKGTLLFFAAYCGHEAVVRAIAEAEPHGLRANAWAAFSALASHFHFDGALLLLPSVVHVVSTSSGMSFPLAVSRKSGDNFLHRAARIGKPPIAFIKAVLAARRRLQLDVNERNFEGLTALHLVAKFASGADGREAVKLLLAAGADEAMVTADGATAKQLAANGYVREGLSTTAVAQRQLPDIDPADKEAIDACADSSQFPPLPDVKEPLPEPNASAAPGNDETADGDDGNNGSKRRELNLTTKMISQEDVDALLGRLYDQSIAKKKRDYADALEKLADEDKARYHSKSLSTEEVEASVQRLYQQEMEGRLERATAMVDKYIPAKDPPKQLDPAEMEDTNQRLCNRSLEYLAESRRTLTQKYSPAQTYAKLSKDEVAACAQRLHDQSTEQSKKEMMDLFEQYAVIPKGRFNGERKMTNDEIKAMGDRLCKAK